MRLSAYWSRVGWPSVTEIAQELTAKTKRHDLSKLEFIMIANEIEITEETWPVLQQSLREEVDIKVNLPYRWDTSYSLQIMYISINLEQRLKDDNRVGEATTFFHSNACKGCHSIQSPAPLLSCIQFFSVWRKLLHSLISCLTTTSFPGSPFCVFQRVTVHSGSQKLVHCLGKSRLCQLPLLYQ